MKYIKPEIKVINIEIKEKIATNTLESWLTDNYLEEAGITTFMVNS